jgi:hypothetical protein
MGSDRTTVPRIAGRWPGLLEALYAVAAFLAASALAFRARPVRRRGAPAKDR